MKKIVCLLLAALMLFAVIGCSKTKFYDGYTYSEYVTVGNYKGVEVDKGALEDAVESAKDAVISSATETVEVTDRGAAKGDAVTVDYTVTVDGNKIDALAKTGLSVNVEGDNPSLRFEKIALLAVDKKANDTFQIKETLTKDDKVSGVEIDTEGKEAVIDVTVKKVTNTVVPEEITDEMVAKYTSDEYKTLDEYLKDVRENEKQGLALQAVVDASKVLKYPKEEAEEYFNIIYTNTAYQWANMGYSLEDYASMFGMTLDDVIKTMTKQASDQTIQDMVALTIYEKEGLSYSEEDYDRVLETLVKSAGAESEEAYRELNDEDRIVLSVKIDAVMRYLSENAVEVEKEEETTAAEEETTAVEEEETTVAEEETTAVEEEETTVAEEETTAAEEETTAAE